MARKVDPVEAAEEPIPVADPIQFGKLVVSVSDLQEIRKALVTLASGSPDSMLHRKQITAPALAILDSILPAE